MDQAAVRKMKERASLKVVDIGPRHMIARNATSASLMQVHEAVASGAGHAEYMFLTAGDGVPAMPDGKDGKDTVYSSIAKWLDEAVGGKERVVHGKQENVTVEERAEEYGIPENVINWFYNKRTHAGIKTIFEEKDVKDGTVKEALQEVATLFF